MIITDQVGNFSLSILFVCNSVEGRSPPHTCSLPTYLPTYQLTDGEVRGVQVQGTSQSLNKKDLEHRGGTI